MRKRVLSFFVKKDIKFWVLTLPALFVGDVQSQSTMSDAPTLDLRERYYQNGTWTFNDTIKIMRDDLFTYYKNQFGLGDHDQMVLIETVRTDSLTSERVGKGNYASKYVQYHKGYEVVGAHMSVLGQFNVALRASGFIMKGLNVEVANPISEEEALQLALADIGAEAYLWDNDGAEAELLDMGLDEISTFYPKGTLNIRRIRQGTEPTDYKLSWVFTIKTAEPVGQIYTRIIDAISGEVLEAPNPLYGIIPLGKCGNTV